MELNQRKNDWDYPSFSYPPKKNITGLRSCIEFVNQESNAFFLVEVIALS